MQAVTVALNREAAGHGVEWSQVTTAPVAWLTRLFGCWHQEMSRPFTHGGRSYRVCLECGAHRHFNTQSWEMTGPFFYETPEPATELYRGATAEVRVLRAERTQPRSLRAAAC